MESDTQTIDVDAPARRVFAILADPASMPSWTNGFVSAARSDGGLWILQTARGVLHWRVAANHELLTVDFYTEAEHPERATYARILPSGSGSIVLLTMIQWPDIDDNRFAYMKRALKAELISIKAMAEDPAGT